MTNYKRDNLGYIDLTALGCVLDNGTVLIGGEKYFYKDSSIGAFKELVVDELAKDYGIICAHYDLASFPHRCGLISKDLNEGNQKFVPLYEMLSAFYFTTSYKSTKPYNNMDDIGIMLEQQFDRETFKRLINQLDDIYLFDRLVGNPDRNVTNYGLLYHDDTVVFAIFDNELSMDTDVVYDDKYQLKRGRNRDDSTDISADRVSEWCKSIDDEHLDSVFARVEGKIQAPINSWIKRDFRAFFRTSRDVISKKIPKSYVK